MASNSPKNITISPRSNPSSYEGVGSRVVRGPDWKWGRQVSMYQYVVLQSDYAVLLGSRLLVPMLT